MGRLGRPKTAKGSQRAGDEGKTSERKEKGIKSAAGGGHHASRQFWVPFGYVYEF